MKKLIVASIVGGIIIFLWQFLSFAALDLHRPAQQYTPKQDTLLSVLTSNLQEGRYFLPTTPVGASSEEVAKQMEVMMGKPWAIVDYHAKTENNMGMNIVRSLLTNMIIVFLFCWILTRGGPHSFNSIFISSLFVGWIGFLNFPYAYYIWYTPPGIWQDLTDAIVPWAINGVWLGWWLKRN